MLLTLALAAAGAAACTTLGPTPATTGLTARPMPRDGVDLQVGGVPGHHLSASATEDPDGATLQQLSAAVQYDELIGLPGLVLGLRAVGQDGDTPIDPVVGYRRVLGDGSASMGGFVYGSRASHDRDGASYAARRIGGELAGDVRLVENRWLEPHVFGGFDLHHLDVSGTYCTDATGQWAQDCAEPPDPPRPTTTASASGVFPAAHVGVSLEVLRHRDSWFHGGRIAFIAAGGTMPHVESSVQIEDESYFSFGLTLSIGVGASASPP